MVSKLDQNQFMDRNNSSETKDLDETNDKVPKEKLCANLFSK